MEMCSLQQLPATDKPIQNRVKLRCRFVPDLVVKLDSSTQDDEHQKSPQEVLKRPHVKRAPAEVAARARAFSREPNRPRFSKFACNNCCHELGFRIIYSTPRQTRITLKTRTKNSSNYLINKPTQTPRTKSTVSASRHKQLTRPSVFGNQRRRLQILSILSPLSVLFILSSSSNLLEALGQHQAQNDGIPQSFRGDPHSPVVVQPSWRQAGPASQRLVMVPFHISNINSDLEQRQLQPMDLSDDFHGEPTDQKVQSLAKSGQPIMFAIVAGDQPVPSVPLAAVAGILPVPAAATTSTRISHLSEQRDNLFATLHGSGVPIKRSPISSTKLSLAILEGHRAPTSSEHNDTNSYHHFYHQHPFGNNIQNHNSSWLKQREAQNSTHRLKVTTKTNDEDVLSAERAKRRSSRAGQQDDLVAAMSVVSPGPLERPLNAPKQRAAMLVSDAAAISAHRMAEQLSFRQAPAVAFSFSADATKPKQTTAEQSSGARAAVSSGESHWIPIVTNNNDGGRANRRDNRISEPVDTPSASAKPLTAVAHGHGLVTRAPPPPPPPLTLEGSNQASSRPLQQHFPRPPLGVVTSGLLNHRQPKAHQQLDQLAAPHGSAANHSRATPTATFDQANRARRRPQEPQLVASSHVHGQRHWHAAPNYYDNNLRHQQRHWHHHQNSHHGFRRRPRLEGGGGGDIHEVISNSIEPEVLEFRPSKMYKRVLLCDKTLVSLDYIRNLEAEPRPSGGQYLNENEISEIGDNFISDFEGTYEVLAARSSNEGTPANQILVQPATLRQLNTTSDTPQPSPPRSGRNNDTTMDDEGKAALVAAPSERRHYRQHGHRHQLLLSDDDPLVRCDMWDLEKGLKSRKPPEAILRQATKADFDTVRDAINRCRQLSERTLPPDDEYRDGLEIMSTEDLVSVFSIKRGLIPGTKWCGLGDQANSYNDLGPKHRIDICCRAHDHCPIRSKPFRNDYGVLNIGLYTKSHCDCDADFYRCLREVRSRTADMLGNLYFNVMKLQCMREERLKVCRELRPIALGFERCIRYEDSPVERVFKFTTPPVAY